MLTPFPPLNCKSLRAVREGEPFGGADLLAPYHDIDSDDRDLIEITHEQTRLHRKAAKRRSRIVAKFLWDPKTILASTKLTEPALGDAILPLPSGRIPQVDFAGVLAKRRSALRKELSTEFDLVQLATVLEMAAKSNRAVNATPAPEAVYRFRPYPSPGALYPGEIYVLPAKVSGLAPKPYRYDALRHALIDYQSREASFQTVETAAEDEPPACVLVVASVLSRATAKYGLRGYRLAMLEAGHICQNLTLAAGAMGLRSLVYGSFFDCEFERLLGLDGSDEVVLSSVLLGAES